MSKLMHKLMAMATVATMPLLSTTARAAGDGLPSSPPPISKGGGFGTIGIGGGEDDTGRMADPIVIITNPQPGGGLEMDNGGGSSDTGLGDIGTGAVSSPPVAGRMPAPGTGSGAGGGYGDTGIGDLPPTIQLGPADPVVPGDVSTQPVIIPASYEPDMPVVPVTPGSSPDIGPIASAPTIDPITGLPMAPIGTPSEAPVVATSVDPIIGVEAFPIGTGPSTSTVETAAAAVDTATASVAAAAATAAATSANVATVAGPGGSMAYINNIVTNIMNSVASTPNYVSLTAVFTGTALSVTAIFKLKEHVDSSGQVPLRHGLVRLGVAGAMLGLPFVVTAMQGTVGSAAEIAAAQQQIAPESLGTMASLR